MSYSKVINILDLSLDLSWKMYQDDKVVKGKNLKALEKHLLSLSSKKIHIIFDYNLTRDVLLFEGDLKIENILRNAVRVGEVHYCEFNKNIQIRNLKSLTALPIEELKRTFAEDDEITAMKIAIQEELSNCPYNSLYYLPKTLAGWVKRRINKVIESDSETRNMVRNILLNEKTQPIYSSLRKHGLLGYANQINGMVYKKCVYSYDIKSSYPYQMCNAEYPLTGGIVKENITKEELESLPYLFCAKMELKNITPKKDKFDWMDDISDGEYTFLTPEYEMLKDAYDFTLVRIPQIVIHLKRGKLPNSLTKLIKQMFQEKEESRDSPYLYEKKKKQVNSIFGLFCQDEDLNNQFRRPSIIGYWSIAWAKRELYNLAKISPSNVLYWDTDSIKTTKKLTDEIEIINSNREGKMGIWVEEFAEVDFCCYGRKAYVIDNIPKIAGLPKSAIPKDTIFNGDIIVFKNAKPTIIDKKLVYHDFTLKCNY